MSANELMIHYGFFLDLVRDLIQANPNTASSDGVHQSVGFLDKAKFIVTVF